MHSSRMRTARNSSRLLGGVCLSACWDTPPGVDLETPWVWTWRPPGVGQTPQLPPWVWTWKTSQARPLNFPPGCGPGDPPGQTPGYHSPRRSARHAGIPPARHTGIPPPPLDRMLSFCKNITFANFVCGRYKF